MTESPARREIAKRIEAIQRSIAYDIAQAEEHEQRATEHRQSVVWSQQLIADYETLI